MSARINVSTAELVDEIQRGLPSAPGQLSEQDFRLLCENIARAIVLAVERYDGRLKSPEPDFGEEERVV